MLKLIKNFNYINKQTLIKISKLKIFRYFIVGFSGFCIQITTNQLLIKKYDFSFYLALLIGILFGSIWNFYFFNIFVFKKYKLKGFKILIGLAKYFITTFISLIQNYFIVIILFNFLNVNSIISQIIGISFSVIFNYLIYKKFIWKISRKTYP